jgi:hypothetical protein
MHTFHIPVLGISYSIDTPIKIARFGITSVISIIEDGLIEKMREYHCTQSNEEYISITEKDEDYRAKRITAYLNLVNSIIDRQTNELKIQPFDAGNEIVKLFEMLPDDTDIKRKYIEMKVQPAGEQKILMQEDLRNYITPGSIDVNIMSKVDNLKYAIDGNPMPVEFSDALSAFRGFANSNLRSSVVLSAGYNPRLYNYIENFNDFFPDKEGSLNKKIILKVSDFRSALIQGKILAKKGIWISEFRIESGLNCGGHAFATDGILLGPILDEFKQKRLELANELFDICDASLIAKGLNRFVHRPALKITVQGGIGTANEDTFLREHFGVDGTGWGSPFLLVPEATNVEENTLHQLANAKKDDYFLSAASPLGVPFNNFRPSTSEQQRKVRIMKNRPGSPCYKKFLSTDTEFTTTPICTASRQYQVLKINQLEGKNLPKDQFQTELKNIIEKDCLCEGLTVSVLLKDNIPVEHKLNAVSICPGPNLAYFSGVFSLQQMVDHIYGRINILNSLPRPNMFINELQLYIDYLRNAIEQSVNTMNTKQNKYFNTFKENMLKGIEYYRTLIPSLKNETQDYIVTLINQLSYQHLTIAKLNIPQRNECKIEVMS